MNSLVSFFPLFLNPFSKAGSRQDSRGKPPSSLLRDLDKLVV